MYMPLVIVVCGSHGFSSDVLVYNALVLGALVVSLLFNDLSGHSYPSTFF